MITLETRIEYIPEWNAVGNRYKGWVSPDGIVDDHDTSFPFNLAHLRFDQFSP